jgi:hypothetical protein
MTDGACGAPAASRHELRDTKRGTRGTWGMRVERLRRRPYPLAIGATGGGLCGRRLRCSSASGTRVGMGHCHGSHDISGPAPGRRRTIERHATRHTTVCDVGSTRSERVQVPRDGGHRASRSVPIQSTERATKPCRDPATATRDAATDSFESIRLTKVVADSPTPPCPTSPDDRHELTLVRNVQEPWCFSLCVAQSFSAVRRWSSNNVGPVTTVPPRFAFPMRKRAAGAFRKGHLPSHQSPTDAVGAAGDRLASPTLHVPADTWPSLRAGMRSAPRRRRPSSLDP